MLIRLLRRHPREWGRVEWLAVSVLGALLATLITVVVSLARGPGRCGDDLEEIRRDCVGVTAEAFEADPGIESLIRAVADENTRVKQGWESPLSGPKIPYVRIALMMPFAADEHSAMTTDMIRRGLAGALTAQKEANQVGGPHYQLLLAPDGRNLDAWKPVVTRIAELAKDPQAPLIGVTGIPSSTLEMRTAIAALSKYGIPTVGPVISATDMNSKYFFKTSPNNDQSALALRAYLNKYPEQEKGFLVWDNRSEDIYSQNLRSVFEKHFGDAYSLTHHNSNYIGTSGTNKGIPQRFTDAVLKICTEKSDTVFFAGRDQDLPAFINRLAEEGTCGRTANLRILRVSTGLDPSITADEPTQSLHQANATVIDASSVDRAQWGEKHQPPNALDRFLLHFKELEQQHGLGTKPLDDGYAVMYHDAFTLLSKAEDRAFAEVNSTPDGKPPRIPNKDDVYNTLIVPSFSDGSCSSCLVGAGGTYGFEGEGRNDQWAVCKPVPVVEYPPSNRPLPSLYRTYQNSSTNPCRS